jgi:hypothetical protein
MVAIAVRWGQAPSKRTAASRRGEIPKGQLQLICVSYRSPSQKGHHAARPRGALIATRTRGAAQRRHRVACPRGAMLSSGAPTSDHHPTGINPRRDGDRVAVACWLRLASDGDKPQRNEKPPSLAGCDCRPMGTSPNETKNAFLILVSIIVRWGQAPTKRRIRSSFCLRLSSDGDKSQRNEDRLKAGSRFSKGHHAARPRGALIATRTRNLAQRRHHVACPRGAMLS